MEDRADTSASTGESLRACSDLICDVGMHTGEDTEFYLKKGFRVLAVEANPALCARNAERFSEPIAQGRLTILHACVADRDGVSEFHVNRTVTEWSSAHEHLGARGGGADRIEVPARALDSVFRDHGVPYYLKIDIEGSDDTAIRALRAMRIRPVYVSYEASSFAGAALLFGMGYTRFAVARQREVPQIRLPDPAREGLRVDHRFVQGSSGPFGKEVAAPWGTIDDCVREQVIWRHLQRNNPGQKNEWADIHAFAPGNLRFFQPASAS